MNIDTLILSGGGPSGTAYVGIFKYLFENNIIDKELNGIKEIITTSIGIMFSIFYILKINESVIENIVMGVDYLSTLDIDNLEINDLLVEYGLFKNDLLANTVKSIIKNTLNKEDITLQELFDITSIKLTVKVYNSTKNITEYISYENNPELKLSILTQMTTAIPLFFKPIKYNDCLYVDGGLKGNLPIEACNSDNYLAILIKGGISKSVDKSSLFEYFPILNFIKSLMNVDIQYDHENIILIEINKGLNFDISDTEKKEMINLGYLKTKEYFNSKKY